MMKLFNFCLITMLCLFMKPGFEIQAQNTSCSPGKFAFHPGETLTYKLSYDWFILWTDMGEVTFTVKMDTLSGIPYLHFLALGSTYKNWDWFFKVRDRYESWVYPTTLKPFYFNRQVNEGDFTLTHHYIFDQKQKKAYVETSARNSPFKKDTIPITACTFDIVSVLYFIRNMDFSVLKLNEEVPVTIFIDNELYNIKFRFLGAEIIKVKNHGKVNCLKFSSPLIGGSVFKEGQVMKIWVSNDNNHIPVYVETPIIVGSVRGTLLTVKGNKYPLTFAPGEK